MQLLAIFRDICLPILLVVGVGWVLDRKFSIDLNALVKLNLYVFVPAFIFTRVSSSDLSGEMGALVVVFSLCIIAVMAAASWLICRVRGGSRRERVAMQLATMFYNSGNWGIPLMTLAFSELGPVVQVFVLMTMNISVFSVGIFLANTHDDPADGHSWWHPLIPVFRQPSIYAVALALIMRPLGNPLAEIEWLWKPLEYLAAGLVGFALLTLGVQLSKTRPPRIAGPLAWGLGIRLLGGPLVALGLTWLFGFRGELAAILIVGAAAPTAVNTALVAHEFKADSRFAAAVVFYSTLLASIVVVALLGIIHAGWIPWAG